MTEDGAFRAKSVTHSATIWLAAPLERVFIFFTPIGEKQWAPGWEPEIVYPLDRDVTEGMVFKTKEKFGETFWVITEYDLARHTVAYANVTPGYILNRIRIVCRDAGNETDATVTYSHVALGEEGNRFIERMDAAAYKAKMAHWTEAINYALKMGRPMTHP